MRRPRFAPASVACAAMLLLGAAEPPATDAGSAWIAANAIRLRTLQPDGKGFDDLKTLRAVIGDARVVLLGEQAHAEGATFLGKTRLIEFLHEEMGFDVLCFESGLYDCDRAWRALKAGGDAWESMSTGVFPIWMQAAELTPLAEYLGREAKGQRPLELCGYDCQLTGSASRDHLLADIKELNAKGSPPPLDEKGLAALDALFAAIMAGKAPQGEARTAADAALTSLRDSLTPERFAAVDERDRAFWRQMLKSLPAFVGMMAATEKQGAPLVEQFNPRDEQGGDTLVWLARERYAGRKIIVWAASMHCVRSPDGIDTQGLGFNYAGVHTMGHVAAQTLGTDAFVLSFVSGPGMAGNAFGRSWQVPDAPAGSLEDRCKALALGPCIVPLRGAAEGTFGAGEFVARPLGNAPMKATWRRHVDAFLFTPNMVQATRRETKAAAPAAPAEGGERR